MRPTYSMWCNNSRKKTYIPVVSPTSIFTEGMRTTHSDSVWCNFSQKYFLYLFFSVIQKIQRTCDGHVQCDAMIREKCLTYLLFHLLQFLQRTCERHTQYDAIFLKSTFHRPVLFPNSIFTWYMRRPYSVWCKNSREKTYIPVVSPTSVLTENKRTP